MIKTTVDYYNKNAQEFYKNTVKVAAMLSEDGVLFMSFKYGDKVYQKDDRLFNCYDESSFRAMFSAIPELTILELYKTADVRDERINEYWLSAIVRKVRISGNE